MQQNKKPPVQVPYIRPDMNDVKSFGRDYTMSKIVKKEELPFDLDTAKKILDKTMLKYKALANNRSASEIAFQWKAKVSYELNGDDEKSVVTITSKNFGYGPIQQKPVQEQYELFESALHVSIDEFNNQNSSNKSQNISAADEIAKFKALLDQGVLTQEEFDAQKAKLLAE